MSKMNYNNKKFRSMSNTDSGEVSGDTVFNYHQKGDLVWAEYEGGEIVFGSLIAKCDEEGVLDMRYQHINKKGALMTGVCKSTPEILEDGRIRLHEIWQWTSGDFSKGKSLVDELE